MIKSALNNNAPGFDFNRTNQQVNKMFDDSEKMFHDDFIRNPHGKTHEDFERFINFISPTDFNSSPVRHHILQPVTVNPIPVKWFVMKQRYLNDLEGHKNNENFQASLMNHSHQELERRGRCLTGLTVQRFAPGPNGQYQIYLVDTNPNAMLRFKEHLFNVDDEVAFCEARTPHLASYYGQVYSLLHNGLVLLVSSLDYIQGLVGQTFSIVLRQYQSTFSINDNTLNKMRRIVTLPQPYPSKSLINTLLRENLRFKDNEAVDLSPYANISFSNTSLNPSQQAAVKSALAAEDVFLIDGPAGTGKTTVLSEIVYQCVQKRLRVLACTPNSISLDNLLQAVSRTNVKCCRIGRSENRDGCIDRFSLDELKSLNKRTKIFKEECDELLKQYLVASPGKAQLLKLQIDTQKTFIDQYLKDISKVIISHSDVIFSTLQGAMNPLLEHEDHTFDVVIIDECSQSTELATWAAILRAKKLIVAGDRLQLPPFIVSTEAKKLDLDYTLFDKLRARLPKNLRKVLHVQYRMNGEIMAWSNQQFYKGKLIANDTCAQYTLQEHLKRDSLIKADEVSTLMLIDTADFNCPERSVASSYVNTAEAALVLEQVNDLLDNFHLDPTDIGVISPYESQAELIEKALAAQERTRAIKCKTVDKFQGKEKEVVIISLVRSNPGQKIGFLEDAKRMNVAVTRAKRFLAIVCDTNTICSASFQLLTSLIQHLRANGQVKKPDKFKKIAQHQTELEIILDPSKKSLKSKLKLNSSNFSEYMNGYKQERLKLAAEQKPIPQQQAPLNHIAHYNSNKVDQIKAEGLPKPQQNLKPSVEKAKNLDESQSSLKVIQPSQPKKDCTESKIKISEGIQKQYEEYKLSDFSHDVKPNDNPIEPVFQDWEAPIKKKHVVEEEKISVSSQANYKRHGDTKSLVKDHDLDPMWSFHQVRPNNGSGMPIPEEWKSVIKKKSAAAEDKKHSNLNNKRHEISSQLQSKPVLNDKINEELKLPAGKSDFDFKQVFNQVMTNDSDDDDDQDVSFPQEWGAPLKKKHAVVEEKNKNVDSKQPSTAKVNSGICRPSHQMQSEEDAVASAVYREWRSTNKKNEDTEQKANIRKSSSKEVEESKVLDELKFNDVLHSEISSFDQVPEVSGEWKEALKKKDKHKEDKLKESEIYEKDSDTVIRSLDFSTEPKPFETELRTKAFVVDKEEVEAADIGDWKPLPKKKTQQKKKKNS